MAEFEHVDFRLENDSTLIVSGPSKGGKTTFVVELLRRKDRLFQHPIRQVYWFHGAAQGPVHRMLREDLGVLVTEGIPTEADFDIVQEYDIVVLDDLQNEMKSNSDITSLFLKQSHHKRFFVILLQQNIYGDKEQRFRNANVHYWVAFNNPRNQRQVGDFLARMYPSGGGKRVIERIFKHIIDTEGNYGYLFVDFTPEMRADLRLRSHIFTSPMHIYKVGDRGTFSEWLALSTLNEKPESNDLSYDNMVLVPKARYHTMVGGGASKSQIAALLEPRKAYAKEAAKELLEFKITPDNVSDYYTKLMQFDKVRRDFFLPKRLEPQKVAPMLPPAEAVTMAPPPATAQATNTSLPRYFLPKVAKAKVKEKRERIDQIQKQAFEHRLKKLRRPPSTQLRDRMNMFQEYAKYLTQ